MSKHKPHIKHPKKRPLDSSTWTVSDLLKAYSAPTGLPGGGAIAIVEFGGGTYPVDSGQAASMNGYSTPTLHDVNAGLTNSPGSDADGEVALDNQNAAEAYSYATGKPAQIYDVWADSDEDALAAVAKLIDSGVPIKAVPISWGTAESDLGQSAALQQGQAYADFHAKYPWVAIIVSTGDNDDGSPGSSVSCPAIYPACIGASGTTKTRTSESVWNSGRGEGTGGGESQYFAVPDYQKGMIPPPASGNWRTAGDMSSVADPDTGFIVITNGQRGVVGGTSAAAPTLAGMIASWNLPANPAFDINKAIYEAASCFTPISIGDNNPSGTGNWPGRVCCGLGVPHGTALYQALLKAAGVAAPTPVAPPTSPPAQPTPPTSPPPPVIVSPPVSNSLTVSFDSLSLTGPFGVLRRTETVSVKGSGTVTVETPPSSTAPTYDPRQNSHECDMASYSKSTPDQAAAIASIQKQAAERGVTVQVQGTKVLMTRADASSFNWVQFLQIVVQILEILAAAGLL